MCTQGFLQIVWYHRLMSSLIWGFSISRMSLNLETNSLQLLFLWSIGWITEQLLMQQACDPFLTSSLLPTLVDRYCAFSTYHSFYTLIFFKVFHFIFLNVLRGFLLLCWVFSQESGKETEFFRLEILKTAENLMICRERQSHILYA